MWQQFLEVINNFDFLIKDMLLKAIMFKYDNLQLQDLYVQISGNSSLLFSEETTFF